MSIRELGKLGASLGGTLGLGALACVACCAAPMALAGAGFGGAAVLSAGVASFVEPWLGVVTFGLVAVAAAAFVIPRALHRSAEDAPEAGACGCGPSRDTAPYEVGSSTNDAPVVCTADASPRGSQAHLARYREAFTQLVSRERFDGGFVWRFRGGAELDEALRSLAEAEYGCCRFFAFRLWREGDEIVWETRAPERASAVLAQYYDLPRELEAGGDQARLQDVFAGAGLRFDRSEHEG